MANKKPVENAPIDHAELGDAALDAVQGGFFRPAPAGDGTTEHFFTVEIGDGQLAKPGLTSTPSAKG